MVFATIQPDGRAQPASASMGLQPHRTYEVRVPQGHQPPEPGTQVRVQVSGIAAGGRDPQVRIVG